MWEYKNKDIEMVKVKFLGIFPEESDMYEHRMRFAKHKCELCGETHLIEMHHVITGKNRRKFFERFFTVRIVCENCHKGSRKSEMITKYRYEVQEELLKSFEPSEVLCIMGRCKLLASPCG